MFIDNLHALNNGVLPIQPNHIVDYCFLQLPQSQLLSDLGSNQPQPPPK